MQRYAFQASVSRISTEPASSIDKVYQLTAIVRGPEGKSTILFGHYLNNRSTWDIGVLGYIGIV